MFGPGDLFEDLAGRLGPGEWLGVCVVVFQVFHDGAFELRDTLEGAAADTFSGDLGEEALDMLSQEAEVGVKCKWKRG